MCFWRCGVAMLVAYGVCAAADGPVRPACTEDRVGRFWPEEANDNPKFAAALMPYGYPEVCTFRDGRYAWRSFTVPVKLLEKERKRDEPSRRLRK